MKRVLLIVMFMSALFQGYSQTRGISYQAVILSPNAQEIPGENAQGNILANSSVSIQFTIVNASGSEEFQEYHTTSTDMYGMINLLIGTGSSTSSNDFTDIAWNGTTKKLKVGIDFSGNGNNFVALNEQLLTYMPQPVSTATQSSLDLKANLASPAFTGTVTAPTFVGALTGNARTATALATPRTINGVAFDGTANITITAVADANTLTGTTLASNVLASSLTSVGTLGSLTVTAPIVGSITGNAATATTATNVSGTVAIANGGTGATTKAAAFDALSPMTAAGDIIYGGAAGTGTTLIKGTADQVLTMNTGATAPEWSTPATGVTPGTTAGDMQYWNGSAWVIIAPGTTGQVLTFVSGVPTWMTTTDVYNPTTGRIWMDRNLGATQVATSSTDALAYGDLYQWGRGTDGHQIRTSNTTSTLSSTDVPGHSNFILAQNYPYDWRSPQNIFLWVYGINSPCPSGYRLPAIEEWNEEIDTWSSPNAAGAFGSPLKLPVAGSRSRYNGVLKDVDIFGDYWSLSAFNEVAEFMEFESSDVGVYDDDRAQGMSVRCIKD